MKTPLIAATLCAFVFCRFAQAEEAAVATDAVNTLGIELLAKTKADSNALLSPYSIQVALAMTYAGADGKTREEMAKTLHFPQSSPELNKSFNAIINSLNTARRDSEKITEGAGNGGPKEPITLAVANRLYGQQGFAFRPAFLDMLKESYEAPLEPVDFINNAEKMRLHINAWVGEVTKDRIRDLIPAGSLTGDTRLVLVNAIYLKAAWEKHFEKSATRKAAFQVDGADASAVPTMVQTNDLRYAKQKGFTAVAMPYVGGQLQFLILLPDEPNGLPALEAKLTPAMLADCAQLKSELVELWLPKFKMEPPSVKLSAQLESLGMKTAFDIPKQSANFDGMAPRTPKDYLYISEVFHKAFLSLDEEGTEAAAATAVVMMLAGAAPMERPKPIEVHVNRPFLFAIQDTKTGVCLFLGRVTDPR